MPHLSPQPVLTTTPGVLAKTGNYLTGSWLLAPQPRSLRLVTLLSSLAAPAGMQLRKQWITEVQRDQVTRVQALEVSGVWLPVTCWASPWSTSNKKGGRAPYSRRLVELVPSEVSSPRAGLLS